MWLEEIYTKLYMRVSHCCVLTPAEFQDNEKGSDFEDGSQLPNNNVFH